MPFVIRAGKCALKRNCPQKTSTYEEPSLVEKEGLFRFECKCGVCGPWAEDKSAATIGWITLRGE